MKRHESGQRFPLTVKVGSASVKIYRGKSRGYDLFTLVYYEHGERKRETFGKLENAKTRATDVATQIARGRAGLLTLSNADRESYLAAANLLSSLGIPLHAAVEEYVTARSYLIGESLVEVASKHAKRNGNVTDKRVAELVEELLAVKEADGASIRYRQSLRSHLRRFAAAFKTNIGSVTAPAIDAWLRSTGGGLRTRRNLRMSVITLFHFARDRGHLPKGDTEADQVKRLKRSAGVTLDSLSRRNWRNCSVQPKVKLLCMLLWVRLPVSAPQNYFVWIGATSISIGNTSPWVPTRRKRQRVG